MIDGRWGKRKQNADTSMIFLNLLEELEKCIYYLLDGEPHMGHIEITLTRQVIMLYRKFELCV